MCSRAAYQVIPCVFVLSSDLIIGFVIETILVRAYEDRTDLLRCLIIGPENTPYEDAPFVIDWMLDSNFPHSPPIAHFLSWTNGNGRGELTSYLKIALLTHSIIFQ